MLTSLILVETFCRTLNLVERRDRRVSAVGSVLPSLPTSREVLHVWKRIQFKEIIAMQECPGKLALKAGLIR